VRDFLDPDQDYSPVYRQVFAEAPVAIALLDGGLRIVDANTELLAMLGRDGRDLRGRAVEVLASPPHPARLALLARKALQGRGPVEVRHRYRRADGEEGWARTWIRRVDSRNPNVLLVCVVQDFTNDQMALEEQRREAERDPLTGLLNRRGGDRRLRAALEKMARSGPVAVIVCDADRFKAVNDRFGHAAGDEVLAGIAGRLRSAVRDTDEVARIGGDEFIVVARVADQEEAAAIADRCVRIASGPFRLGGPGIHPERVTLSAGVAIAYPGGPVEPGSLLAAADRALYAAKAEGGGRWMMASPD
jgi:diguanylate cyclase (GGDEF)-like protein/PAS domain S-box-containing protein